MHFTRRWKYYQSFFGGIAEASLVLRATWMLKSMLG
jgi:hypothetical protein